MTVIAAGGEHLFFGAVMSEPMRDNRVMIPNRSRADEMREEILSQNT
jgi:hypothetical protein